MKNKAHFMFAKIFEIKIFKPMQTYAYALDAMLV